MRKAQINVVLAAATADTDAAAAADAWCGQTLKVVLWDRDVKAMCSLRKCKQ